MRRTLLVLLAALLSVSVSAQSNRVDIVRHDAPRFAHFGPYDIGVRTLEFTNRNQADVLNTVEGGETVFYDRDLTVEIWYPAELASGQISGGTYTSTTRNLTVIATLHGRAVRDAAALKNIGPMPLIIISHGYPGNRYLMSHLGENLASKGYIVASIDHRDSTYKDHQAPSSSVYNRTPDQLFVLDQMASLSAGNGSFLNGLVDSERTGIVGYSLGGTGLINALGGGFSDDVITHENAPANGLASRLATSNPEFRQSLDPRVKAGIAIAPWGMQAGMWSPEDLKGIRVPTFYMAGSLDETVGYENGTRAIFENASNSDRYLLTFLNAGHNAIAPIPLPIEIHDSDDHTGADHYTDAVWDSVRSSNIMIHFATAFLDYQLKGNAESRAYLNLIPNAADGIYAVEDDLPTDTHTYWKGFPRYTARGLVLEHLRPTE
jgi:predicted dienelactone hydrolase